MERTRKPSNYCHTMFVATAQDGSEPGFPITFRYSDSENNISWEWFLNYLKVALGHIDDLVFISDRHASIEGWSRRVGERRDPAGCVGESRDTAGWTRDVHRRGLSGYAGATLSLLYEYDARVFPCVWSVDPEKVDHPYLTVMSTPTATGDIPSTPDAASIVPLHYSANHSVKQRREPPNLGLYTLDGHESK
ncbi:hypothetical protein Ddye_027220 [Dipteronia dyeriana]|uniref:MULE transposase domain-containing protein n=1 Tax=Dipteronia dyeriana TaxID=168575 RepID=A0AAD9TNQ1_9ROSI|nr:hypothetical protein Ddye_027220 [Dipteronia dyeriana]